MTREPAPSTAARAAAAVLLGAVLAAQDPVPLPRPQQVPEGWREVPRPTEFAAGRDDSLFSLPRSQEDLYAFEQALADLAKGEHAVAVDRLHRLLREESGGVLPVGPGRWFGVRLAVTLTLANLQPAATAAYEALVRREAGAVLDRPLHELPVEQLTMLAERFPASDPGRRARLRLGDLALECGDAVAAAGHFRAALDAAPIGSDAERAVRARLRIADVMQWPPAFRAAERDALVEDVLSVLPAEADASGWNAAGGPGAASGRMTEPLGSPTSQWADEVFAPGFDYESGNFAMAPVGDVTALHVNNGLRLQTYDPLRKELSWASTCPMLDGGDEYSSLRDYAGAMNPDFVLSAAVGEDVVIAPLQVPERSANVDFRGAFRIISRIPERRLFAFERSTGKLLWSHFDQLDGPVARRFQSHAASGPPRIHGDTVYAPVHDRSGAIAFYLAAYDLRTGQPRWRRLVCSSQQEVNMFGNARQEFAAGPLQLRDGVVHGTTNLGICYAIEAATGRIRWLSSYEVIPLPATQLQGQQERVVYFANNTPVVAGGVVAFTPLDSRHAIAFDTETGLPLWRLEYEARVDGNNDVRWLLGAARGEFVFSGSGIVAVQARPEVRADLRPTVRQVVPREQLLERGGRRELPRPALTGEFVYHPSQGKLSIFGLDGVPAPHNGSIKLRQPPGSLLLVDGLLVALRDRLLDIQFDPEALLARAEALLKRDPDDPSAILRLVALQRTLGSAQPSADLEPMFLRGLAAADRRGLGPDHPLRRSLARELFESILRRATQARGTEAVALLKRAREMCPDPRDWLAVQVMIVDALAGDDQAVATELAAVAARAGTEEHDFREAGRMPVIAWVRWRTALLAKEPTLAVERWQELLENHGDVTIGSARAADLAATTIADLVSRHGPGVYAAVAARADAELAAAGTDAVALERLQRRFPHSKAAASARSRLIDLAVQQGNLTVALEMLTGSMQARSETAGLLRRAMLACANAGNRALAAALGRRILARHAGESSDWPADGGASLGQVVSAEIGALEARTTAPALTPPAGIVGAIRARNLQASFVLPALEHAQGFPDVEDEPLYARYDEYLLAYDVSQRGAVPPLLFRRQIRYVEGLVRCGRVLVVVDTSEVAGIDHRTGETVWQLSGESGEDYYLLGVQQGLLHVWARTGGADSDAALLGIEPLRGALVFRRPANGMVSAPKALADGNLVQATMAADGTLSLEVVCALSGATLRRVPLDRAMLAKLGINVGQLLGSGLFPQGMDHDGTRSWLAIEGSLAEGSPRVLCLDAAGGLAWQWTGTEGRRLQVAARRDGRIVVVESGQRSGGRTLVLDAATGSVLRERALGESVQVLNWSWSLQARPAPVSLVIADRDPQRRLTCMPVADGAPGAEFPLGAEDGEPLQSAVLDGDLLVAGFRSAGRGPTRVHAFRLSDRSGALPDGRASIALPTPAPTGLRAHGPYTVVAANDGITILGAAGNNR